MFRRILPIAAVAGALLLIAAVRTEPGGWAVITVEDLPDHLAVGSPITLAYWVRQHGQTAQLLSGLTGEVSATKGGQKITGTVSASGPAGRYVASLVLPESGNWTIVIYSGFVTSELKLDSIPAIGANAALPVAEAPALRGRHLFIAKGCVGCHTDRAVAGSGSFGVGPELTAGRLGADYVRMVLADPTKAVIPANTTFNMPNLNLKPAEIDALVAFLTETGNHVAAADQH